MDDEGPKYRLEHAVNSRATCQRAACKRSNVKFVKGELRIGTHTFFEPESRWYMAWRHWGCATKHQIKSLNELTENDPTKAPGYDRLSPESQEQVRLAFENEGVVDKEFKDVREDLAKNAPKYGGEIRNAVGYGASVALRAAACRGPDCLKQGTKIVKDELRLGFSIPYDGEHSSMVYKHWRCITEYDLEQITALHKDELLDGIDNLPAEYQQAVKATLESGKVVDPPKIEPVKKPRKSRAKKRKADDDESDGDSDELEDTPKPKPKRSRKKKAMKDEQLSDEEEEPEYIPRKTRSRGAKVKEEVTPAAEVVHEAEATSETETAPEAEVETEMKKNIRAIKEKEADPAVLKIEAMAAAMRESAKGR